jgi:hypothetical protein
MHFSAKVVNQQNCWMQIGCHSHVFIAEERLFGDEKQGWKILFYLFFL